MDIIIISITAFVTAGLTLYSGFGLGTLLMPVFALFFPIDIAISMTAVVHLMNNIFKFAFLGRYARKDIVIKFGAPAIIAAFLGAWILLRVSDMPALFTYSTFGRTLEITPVKLLISMMLILFSIIEFSPEILRVQFSQKMLPVGGFLSGFFGGISGHQGALRSAFLLRYGLSKEVFIATGVVIACIVDIVRIFVYSTRFSGAFVTGHVPLLVAAVIAAFLGVLVANRLLKKMTFRTIQILISVMLFLIALGLASGII